MRRIRAKQTNSNILKIHINEHRGIYIVISIMFVIGFIVGTINAAFIDENIRNESHNYILNFVEYLKTQEINNKILLKESLIANIKPLIYIMLFGLIFIGAPFILVYIGLYGYSIGFTVTSILASLGTSKGIIFIFAMMIPQEIILLPTLAIIATNAILFSKMMLRINNRSIDIKKEFLKYSIIAIMAALVIIGVSLFETYISSNLTKIAIQLI